MLVEKGALNKEKFYVPQNEIENYDGNTLRFKLSKEEKDLIKKRSRR